MMATPASVFPTKLMIADLLKANGWAIRYIRFSCMSDGSLAGGSRV